MTNTFTVRSIEQKALFDHEIKGQLTDGQWESVRPIGHWKPWSNANVVVANEGGAVGRNFSARDKYDLTVLAGNDVIRGRMITTVKLILTFDVKLSLLLSKLFDVDGSWIGLPAPRGEGSTNEEDMLGLQICELFPTPERLGVVRTLVDLQRYTRNDLLADLKDLKDTMQVVC